MSAQAMFPLGTVVVPTQTVPLQLFEPRYVALIEHVMDTDRLFGTCLIERGSEVGGGDQRLDVGTLVRVDDARPTGDGRWLVKATGVTRLRVQRWLVDDPYPAAEIELAADPTPGSAEAAMIDGVRDSLRAVVGDLAERQGQRVPTEWLSELPASAVDASYVLVDNSPFGPLDRYRLLAAETVGLRLALLDQLISELADLGPDA